MKGPTVAARLVQVLSGPLQEPMAVWRDTFAGEIGGKAVDMTLRLNNAGALSTCQQPQQQLCAA